MHEAGYCECGCGGLAPLAPYSNARRGYVKGQPLRFIHGHNAWGPRKPIRYIEEDRGYRTPCWIWQLALSAAGYGVDTNRVGSRLAHRRMYEQHRGPIGDLQLDHLCRVPSCVNPDHLEPVTPAENTRRSTVAKLNERDVAEIRARCDRGETDADIATLYGLHPATIWHVRHRRNWRDVA